MTWREERGRGGIWVEVYGGRAMLDHTWVALGESAKERESDGVVHGDLMSSSRSGNKGLVRSEAMDTVPSSR